MSIINTIKNVSSRKKKLIIFLLLIFAGIISLVIYASILIFGVSLTNHKNGYAYYDDKSGKVIYEEFITITNRSLFTYRIQLEIKSKQDMLYGFLKNEELIIEELYLWNNSQNDLPINKNDIIVKTNDKTTYKIKCIGEYGGSGKIMRHGPQTITINGLERITDYNE